MRVIKHQVFFTSLVFSMLITCAPVSAQETEFIEESQDISSEEKKFIDEEFTPPKEAPYTDEVTETSVSQPAIQKPASSIKSEKYEQSGLQKVTAKGEYIYQVPESYQKWAVKFKVGPYDSPDLANQLDNGNEILFSDIYGDTASMMFNLDVEYQLFKSVGTFGVKVGTGFYNANGNGRFKRDPTKIAREEYDFYLLPNSLGAIYHLDYFRRQILVPYAFANAYYFTFLETRDDKAKPKYGGALATSFGGGVALMLDGLDRKAMNMLDADHGVNHMYLIAEYENIIGLNDEFDFSNQIYSGGLLVEF